MRLPPFVGIGEGGRGEGLPNWGVPQPWRIWRTNVDHGMMHVRGTPRTKFRHLYPPVLRKVRRDDFVGVLDYPARRNLYRLGHLHHQIGLRNVPALGPLSRWRRVVLVSRRRARIGPLPAR